MTRREMIRAVDEEIRRLEAIRDQLRTLAGNMSMLPMKPRNLSDEGRRRIAEAQHRRWAGVRAMGKIANTGAAQTEAVQASQTAG